MMFKPKLDPLFNAMRKIVDKQEQLCLCDMIHAFETGASWPRRLYEAGVAHHILSPSGLKALGIVVGQIQASEKMMKGKDVLKLSSPHVRVGCVGGKTTQQPEVVVDLVSDSDEELDEEFLWGLKRASLKLELQEAETEDDEKVPSKKPSKRVRFEDSAVVPKKVRANPRRGGPRICTPSTKPEIVCALTALEVPKKTCIKKRNLSRRG